MTISSETTKSGPYTGNGSTTVFAYSFLVYDQADLEVVLTVTATGVETIQTISTHYSVSGVGASSGNVTMETAPTSAQTLTIRRVQALTQGTDLTNQGAYVGETHERVFDETIQKLQQVNEVVDRSVRVSVSQSTSGIDFTLPAPTASTVLAVWNAAADGLEAGPTASAISSAQTYATNASASATTAAGEASAANPKYTFSTTTSMADPGAGILRYNHGTVASVSAIALDELTADTGNPDIEAWLKTFDDSTSTIKGWLRLVEPGTPANYAVFHVTALTDNSGWIQLAVTHVDSNGTFSDTDSIRLMFSRTGDKGDTGSTGSTGNVGGILMTFETATADSDQGSGKVWLNHGTASSATVVYMDDLEAGGASINSLVDSWDDSTTTALRGTISIYKNSAPENFHIFNLTGVVTSASTYSKLASTHVVSSGTISDADPVSVQFVRTGDTGAAGTISGAADGSAGSPSIAFASDTDLGFHRSGANQLAISSGGSAVAQFDTTGLDVVGDVTAATLNADGDTSAGDNAAIGYTAAEGLILAGQGSVSDVVIKNDADATVFSIATGTTTATFAGTVLAKTDTDTSNTGTVTLDFTANQHFVLTLTGNLELGNPSTEQVGQSGILVLIQDGTGSRTLSLQSQFKTAGDAGITLSTAGNAVDIIPYFVSAADSILLGAVQLAMAGA
jgi:hypothetical protein